MSDLFFKKFYNEVKDSTWPDVENYFDFLNLPVNIRTECVNLHYMHQRINQIESPTYWQTSTAIALQYKNLAYIPVPKCASMYYTKFFTELNWKEVNISELEPDTVCFGILQEPASRYLKGITEWVFNELMPIFDYDANAIPVGILNTLLIGDSHSLPYTTKFGPWLEQINFIPMYQKTDDLIKQHLMDLFLSQDCDIKIPLSIPRVHESDAIKLELYRLVQQSFEDESLSKLKNYNGRLENLYVLLSEDLKFYRNLVNTFDPTWQTIKKLKTSHIKNKI